MSETLVPDRADAREIHAIAHAEHGDPFAILGMHVVDGIVVVRTFSPQASLVEVVDAGGDVVATLECSHDAGFFAGTIPNRTKAFPYTLRLTIGATTTDVEDAYRFGPVLGEVDVYLIGEGRHERLFDVLGSHETTIDGVDGTTFAVWAPNARRVSVVGDFNDWDGRRLPMREQKAIGVWEIFAPGVRAGARYHYELLGEHERLPLKSDPFGFRSEVAPGTASIVSASGKPEWHDDAYLARRAAASAKDAPIAIYEVHLGSWRRADGNRYLTYGELADQLIPYAASMGFTHLELMPVSEHPFDGSWGYQVIGMYAPTGRFGTPAEFAEFVDRAHQAGLGVILDWVPGHFPTDAHGLANFDGTRLYEHEDPRQGFQPDWNTLVFNFGRTEVVNYLVANAAFWIERYHVDGLRVDAVASMLYLDFSREPDAWVPNRYGGRENLEAIDFLKATNERIGREGDGAVTIAEESTAWPGVSRPVAEGGLGFDYKWNLGWMHDTLDFGGVDPIFRSYSQNDVTFGFTYAYDENFVLPFSHDEVVHGKGSLVNKMSGDRWQKLANLRSLYGFMYAHPGKKLIFMGDEFAQEREWNHDRSLDWHLLGDGAHAGMANLIRDLNNTYRGLPALYRYETEPAGLEFVVSDKVWNVVAFARLGERPRETVVAITNFTPIVRAGYRVGVPCAGTYREAINTDDERYGGSGVTGGPVHAEAVPWHDQPFSVVVRLPPLATVLLALEIPPESAAEGI